MQTGIHPNYVEKAKYTCACGATFEIGSTRETVHVDLCSQCHPFYTGKQKLVDTEGRVEKFEAKRKAAEAYKKAQGVEEDSAEEVKVEEPVAEEVSKDVQEEEKEKVEEAPVEEVAAEEAEKVEA